MKMPRIWTELGHHACSHVDTFAFSHGYILLFFLLLQNRKNQNVSPSSGAQPSGCQGAAWQPQWWERRATFMVGASTALPHPVARWVV